MNKCIQCGKAFEPKGIERICSDDCRREKKSEQNAKQNRTRQRHPEADVVSHSKLFGNTATNDAHILKQKHIHSPDVNAMTIRLHDARLKATFYFRSIEDRDRHIERRATMPDSSPLHKGGKTSKY